MIENKTGYNTEDVGSASSGSSVKLTSEEREVILVMDDKDRKWKVSCSSPTYMRKFEKQGWKCIGMEFYRDGSVCTKFYEAPQASSITIGKAERPKRQGKPMTEEHKRKLQEGRSAKTYSNSI